MVSPLKTWRRKRLLARHTIDESLWREVVSRLPTLQRLTAEDIERLRELALLFLHEKRLEPAGGIELDDTKRVTIAALACLPILELGLDCYDGFASVIVYPGEFVVPNRETVDEAGVVHVGDDILSGECWQRGPVVLAWEEVQESGLGQGFNVVAHEFAHKLDALDGVIDGTPPLHREMRLADWTRSFQTAYDELCAKLDRGEEPWLDPYAAEDPGEFFAVCSEMFFDVPQELCLEYPDLYRLLAAYYRQDPAGHRPRDVVRGRRLSE